jgi:hypothetical protein
MLALTDIGLALAAASISLIPSVDFAVADRDVMSPIMLQTARALDIDVLATLLGIDGRQGGGAGNCCTAVEFRSWHCPDETGMFNVGCQRKKADVAR